MSSKECWQLIATDSDNLQTISSKSSASSKLRHAITPRCAQTPLPSTSTLPLPRPLVSDLLALGCRITLAQNLSRTYLDFAIGLKQKYETELQHVNQACFNINVAIGNPTSGFQLRLRSLYESQYLSMMNDWAQDAISITQRRFMCASLKGRLYSSKVRFHFMDKMMILMGIWIQPAFYVSLQNVCMRSCTIEEEETNFSIARSNCIHSSSRPHSVHLTSLFEQSVSRIKIEEGLSNRKTSCHAFPSAYSHSIPTNRGSCLKIISRGFRRVMHRDASQTTDVDGLSKAFDDLSVSEFTTQPCDTGSDHISKHICSPHRGSTPSLPVVLKPATFNPLPMPTSPTSSTSTPHMLALPRTPLAARMRKIAAIPQRNQTAVEAVTPLQSTTTSRELSPSSELHCPPKSDHSVLTTTISSTPVSIPRRKKFAPLPTRRAPTSTIPPSLAPLSIANVSSLSQSSSPPRSRSNISRTPSLTSMTSNSGSSSPSSDGLDTPPSTPPPFITKFPSSDSPSSLASKSIAPNPASGMSPGSVFQFSSPKKLSETISPSQCAPSFSFSAGIKREDESFSFTFGQ
uniref:B2 mating type protein n=1 Tax=Heterobasidion irregulare TaxID=984962 RepID=S5R9W9_9AGAM|nr:b2 mating type protein [Heterobasidion irregulare]